ncbi:hypothetical protein PInf_002729 [Phytophthora infestans]|nr:hypothetical protein PInf_002729 [Phytophthora infestans]
MNIRAKSDRQLSIPQAEEKPPEGPEVAALDRSVCTREGGGLFAEDLQNQMAILPEVTTTTQAVQPEDIRIGGAGESASEDIERLIGVANTC